MNNRLLLYILSFLVVLCIPSCSDETIPDIPNNNQNEYFRVVSPQELYFDRYERYYEIIVEAQNGEIEESTYKISVESDWLIPVRNYLPSTGQLQFLALENNNDEDRTVSLTITSQKEPSKSIVLEIVQRGLAYYDDNSSTDFLSDFRVGYGFNSFDEYNTSRGLRKRVIDEARLIQFDGPESFNCIQEVIRANEKFETYSAYSLEEMSSKLTKSMNQESNFLGVKKTLKRFTEVSHKSQNEQFYGYGRLTKTVASRTYDQGALKYIFHEANLDHDDLPFTSDFREIYNKIINNTQDRSTLIREMINEFGTHIITSASVGGKLDYVLCFDRRLICDLETAVEQNIKYVFGRIRQDETTAYSSSSITSEINNNNSIQIEGGSQASKDALKRAVGQMTNASQLSSDIIREWMASIIYTDPESASSNLSSLGLIDFEFIPIWELFSDQQISWDIQKEISRMADEDQSVFTQSELGLDNYRINLKDNLLKTLPVFGTTPRSTLVKVLYQYEGIYLGYIPILEVCNEYIPKLRGDKRVTVYYPISNGTTKLTEGIFPGDGEGNRPAYLSFSDDNVYVNPIPGYGYNDILENIYYVHGHLYASDYGVPYRTLSPKIEYQWLEFTNKYPIVKIGSGYWTRKNITEEMEFGEPYDPNDKYSDYYIYDVVINNMLYANIFWGNSSSFMYNNKIYGPEEDNIYQERIKWYLPKEADIYSLKNYTGNSTKALFKGQVSGLDLEFAGYYGIYDDLNPGQQFDEYGLHYEGNFCFLASKNNSNTGSALVLDRFYELWSCPINKAKNNWYPIRLFRTSYFKYNNIKYSGTLFR